MTRLQSLVCLCMLSSASFAVRAEVLTLEWDASGRFERSVVVAPGKFVELCGSFTQGDAVAWAFESEQPLSFNVHFHAGPRVVYPEKREATREASGKLRIESDQDYCWMWTNETSRPSALRFFLNR